MLSEAVGGPSRITTGHSWRAGSINKFLQLGSFSATVRVSHGIREPNAQRSPGDPQSGIARLEGAIA